MVRFLKRKALWGKYKPTSATVSGWEDWAAKAKKEHPVKYFFLETLNDTVFFNIRYQIGRIGRAKWWLYHRFHPKHKYNVVKCKALKPGYYDPAELILHAPFTLLCDFVDSQLENPTISWEEGHNLEQWEEMQTLYKWYMVERPARQDVDDGPVGLDLEAIEEKWGFMWPLNEKYEDTEEYRIWKEWAEWSRDIEATWLQEDTDMLVRLVKIKNYIWYP